MFYIWLWVNTTHIPDTADYIKRVFNPEYFDQKQHTDNIVEFTFSTEFPLGLIEEQFDIGVFPTFTRLLYANPRNAKHTTFEELESYKLAYSQYRLR